MFFVIFKKDIVKFNTYFWVIKLENISFTYLIQRQQIRSWARGMLKIKASVCIFIGLREISMLYS